MSKPTHADRLSDEQRRRAEHLGNVCKTRRQTLGLTQAGVAAEIGVSPRFYGSLERGEALPGVTTLAAMTRALHVRADELLGLDFDSAGENAPSALAMNPGEKKLFARIMEASPDTREVADVLLATLNAQERRRRKRK